MEKLQQAIKDMLQAARERLGVSAREFAESHTDWSPHTYIKWERGQRTPTVTSLVQLADAMGADALTLTLRFPDGETLEADVFERGDQ